MTQSLNCESINTSPNIITVIKLRRTRWAGM